MTFELTREENELIQAYILLPLAYKVLANDTKAIDHSRLKFKKIYYDLVEKALKQLSYDLRDVKAAIRRQNIKMIQHNVLDYEAVVRGWTYNMTIHSSIAGEWVEKRIMGYLNRN